MSKAAIGPIGLLPKALKPKGLKPAASPIRTSVNPLRKTAKQTVGSSISKKINFKPTTTKNTQPAALRGVGLSVSGMKKLATGRAGRVVKATLKRGRV